MKTLRVWLLILLAIALPLRGAMAAAMLCAPGPVGAQAMAVPGGHAPDHSGHAIAAVHDHATLAHATLDHVAHDDVAHDHMAHIHAGHVQTADDHASHSHASHAHAHPTPGDPASPAPAHDAGEKCTLCASCCSASIPVTTTITLPQAPPATAAFPACLAPPAEFVSGGQDRPPRSI